MSSAYTFVEGDSLLGLLLEVRDAFDLRPPCDVDEPGLPNSVQAVALDLFTDKPVAVRAAVLTDLLAGNADLVLERRAREVFVHADTPEAFLTDLVCEVVRQVLLRDERVRTEDDRRIALAMAWQQQDRE